jgi:energy-coupling factor transporter ATP-binding protein EcfA2
LGEYDFCFKLSPYHIVNSYLAIVIAQVTDLDVEDLYDKAEKHIEGFIEYALENYPNWDEDTLTVDDPVLMMPIGAAGSGKSTFFKELSNVINFSCDNIRYLLFKEYGPSFSPWESGLSWWIVNRLVDHYLGKGYNVFYNGVNTDLEYRSPITMEDQDILFAGMPYRVKLVYFEPPVELTSKELEELKSINLWETPIEEVDTGSLSKNAGYVIDFIKINYQRTLTRTEKISSGEESQDPFDILYAVPAPIVKLFVEQSFDKPAADNMVMVKRKEIPDPQERSAFYRKYAEIAMNG